MRNLILLITLAACSAPAAPAQPISDPKSSCGASCGTNFECNHSILPTCKFCNFGTCRAVSPLDPHTDAGIDASPLELR